jgi:hypothetical protein
VAQVLADVGATNLLNRIKAGSDFSLKLFVTDVTPTTSDTNATYTEASGGGYAAKTLAMASATEEDDGAGIRRLSWGSQTWTFTGALTTNLTIYGYYIVEGTTLILAEHLATPFQPAANGDTLIINPTAIKMGAGTPA